MIRESDVIRVTDMFRRVFEIRRFRIQPKKSGVLFAVCC